MSWAGGARAARSCRTARRRPGGQGARGVTFFPLEKLWEEAWGQEGAALSWNPLGPAHRRGRTLPRASPGTAPISARRPGRGLRPSASHRVSLGCPLGVPRVSLGPVFSLHVASRRRIRNRVWFPCLFLFFLCRSRKGACSFANDAGAPQSPGRPSVDGRAPRGAVVAAPRRVTTT